MAHGPLPIDARARDVAKGIGDRGLDQARNDRVVGDGGNVREGIDTAHDAAETIADLHHCGAQRIGDGYGGTIVAIRLRPVYVITVLPRRASSTCRGVRTVIRLPWGSYVDAVTACTVVPEASVTRILRP